MYLPCKGLKETNMGTPRNTPPAKKDLQNFERTGNFSGKFSIFDVNYQP